MTGYLTGFMVYMMAMLGVIFIALVVVKKSINLGSAKQKNNFLKIESSLSLEPRKNLYIVRAGNERFLVSSGVEGCQFMTKIEENNIPSKAEISNDEIKNFVTNNLIGKISIPKLEMPVLNSDYIGLKEILREERF